MSLGRTVLGVLVASAAFHVLFAGFSDGAAGLFSRPETSRLALILLIHALGLPLLMLRPPSSSPRTAARRTPATTLWAIAGMHFVAVLLVGSLITGWSTFTDDEQAYTMLGRLLWQGRVTEPAMVPREAMTNPFIVDVGMRDGVLHWAGCYPLMAGVLTAPGWLVGFPNLLWTGLGALLVVQAARLAEEVWSDVDGTLVAALLAASPTLIAMGAFKHTIVPATLMTALVGRGVLAGMRGARWADAGTGVAIGVLFHTRPLEGVIVCAGVCAVLVYRFWRDPRDGVLAVAAIGAGGLGPFLVWMAYNHAITGHAFRMPYSLLAKEGPVLGFGRTYNGVHTPLLGLNHRFHAMLRFSTWALGGPLAIVACVVALAEYRRHQWRLLVLMGASGLHLAAYVLAPFPAVSTAGPTYRLWMCLPLVLLVGGLARRDRRIWRFRSAVLVGFGYLTFVPLAFWNLHQLTSVYRAPLEVAAELEIDEPTVILLPPPVVPWQTYVYYPPPPDSRTDQLVWSVDTPEARAALRRTRPDHRLLRVVWDGPRASLESVE